MRPLILAAVLTATTVSQSFAGAPFPAITDEVVKQECSDCHMVYQPEMLTQAAWTKMMGDLANHFGEDATLPAETNKRVLDYHLANAADVSTFKSAKRFIRGIDPNKAPLKITDTARYAHKHERISSEVWDRKNIRFKANCIACHTDADKGDYDMVTKSLMYKWVEK